MQPLEEKGTRIGRAASELVIAMAPIMARSGLDQDDCRMAIDCSLVLIWNSGLRCLASRIEENAVLEAKVAPDA